MIKDNILDLHGLTYLEAKKEVESFAASAECPFYIITGNSNKMKDIVKIILQKYKLEAYYLDDFNLGKLLITERPI